MSAPPHARTTTAGRCYRHPETGEEWPSVTTIISGGVPKPALPRWAAKAAAEYAVKSWDTLSVLDPDERTTLIKGAPWKQSGDAADLGTAVHDVIDCLCSDKPLPDFGPDVEPFVEQFLAFVEQRQVRFVRNEGTVVNRTVGYAGTADFWAHIGDHQLLTLGDTKTGKAVYPEVALQLAALHHAEFILADDGSELPMPAAEALCALHLRPRSWSLIRVTPGVASWEAFLAAKRVCEWTRDTAPSVLGARLKGRPAGVVAPSGLLPDGDAQ